MPMNCEDLICPICLEIPHNAVLLKCTYFEKGCRPFICDAPLTLSNCLEQFKTAHKMQSSAEVSNTRVLISSESNQTVSTILNDQPKCPLCRGDIVECVVDETRDYLNSKKRSCQDDACAYSGNYIDLQKHTQLFHPQARPKVVDPVKLSEWEHLLQSSEIGDVLSALHSQVPNGAIQGDYIVDYVNNEAADEYEDFPGDEGQCWTSGLLNEVVNSYIISRNQRITRRSEAINDYRREDYTSHDYDDRIYTNIEDDGINGSAATMPSYSSIRRISASHRSRRRRLNPGFSFHYC